MVTKASLKRELERLSAGGVAGRRTSGHGDRKDSEAINHRQWNFLHPTARDNTPQSPPASTRDAFDDNTSNIKELEEKSQIDERLDQSSSPNILLPKEQLKAQIENNFCCKKCINRVPKKQMRDYVAFVGCQSNKLWLKYVRSSAGSNKPVFTKAELQVSFKENGLAGDIKVRCSTRTRKLQGHVSRCGCDLIDDDALNQEKDDMHSMCARLSELS